MPPASTAAAARSRRLDHHGDAVDLGGGTDHGRAADVDLLDAGGNGIGGDGGLEGIEVDHDQIDRREAMPASVARCAGSSRRARIPPWTPG